MTIVSLVVLYELSLDTFRQQLPLLLTDLQSKELCSEKKISSNLLKKIVFIKFRVYATHFAFVKVVGRAT